MEMDTVFVTSMYDTINFILFKSDYPEVDFLEDIPQLLTKVTLQGESSSGAFINGFLHNYKVVINRWRIKFQDASLAKFMNGDNVQGMSLGRTREALQQLSDQLHLDVKQAKVTRLDLGRNLIMKLPPSNYLNYLGEHTNFKRFPMDGGLLYKNSSRELVFYDKAREQKHKRIGLPELFKDRNLLRFEMRYKNHLELEFNVPRVTLELTTDEKFYISILKRWASEYLKIKKISNKASSIQPTTSTRELMVNLASMSIREIGDETIIRKIGEWQNQGVIGKKQASDHRKFIREATQKEFHAMGNEIIEELDKKIKTSIRFFV